MSADIVGAYYFGAAVGVTATLFLSPWESSGRWRYSIYGGAFLAMVFVLLRATLLK